jgi:hypothetical protein
VQDSEPSQVAEDGIPFRLVHAVRGRARLRVDPPYDIDTLARAIGRILGAPGRGPEIRVDHDSRSVIVTYDPAALDDLVGPGEEVVDEGGAPFLLRLAYEPPGGGWMSSARAHLSSWLSMLGATLERPLTTGRAALNSLGARVASRHLGWFRDPGAVEPGEGTGLDQ